MFTIDDVRRVQANLGLGEFHVVYLDLDEGWSMAHTDAERAMRMDLCTCDVHLWATECGTLLGEYLPDWAATGWLCLARQPGKKELLVRLLADDIVSRAL